MLIRGPSSHLSLLGKIRSRCQSHSGQQDTVSQCNREFLPRLRGDWPVSPSPALKEQNPLGASFNPFSGAKGTTLLLIVLSMVCLQPTGRWRASPHCPDRKMKADLVSSSSTMPEPGISLGDFESLSRPKDLNHTYAQGGI